MMKHVFIITHGRSGSTLLQSVLNTAFGACVRGENNAFVSSLHLAFMEAIKAKQTCWKGSHRADSAWYGIGDLNRERLVRDLRDLIEDNLLRAPADISLTGFKEIRHQQRYVPDLAAYLDFLNELFPDAYILFNIRAVEDTIKSGWWAERPNSRDIVTSMHERFRDAHTSGNWRSHLVTYEDLTTAPLEAVTELAAFLGLPCPPEELIARVMHKRVSQMPKRKIT